MALAPAWTSFARGYHRISAIMDVIDKQFKLDAKIDMGKIATAAIEYGYMKHDKDSNVLIQGSFVLAILDMMRRERRCRIPASVWFEPITW